MSVVGGVIVSKRKLCAFRSSPSEERQQCLENEWPIPRTDPSSASSRPPTLLDGPFLESPPRCDNRSLACNGMFQAVEISFLDGHCPPLRRDGEDFCLVWRQFETS